MMKLVKLFLASLLLVPFPIVGTLDDEGNWVFGVQAARADSDDEDDEDDDEDNDDEEDDDEEDDDEDEDEDDDEDDDREDDEDDDDNDDREDDDEDSDDVDDEDDRRDDRQRNNRAGTNTPDATTDSPRDQSSSFSGSRLENLHLRYPNGWDEKIRNGRYILIDPEGRTVTNRTATLKDLDRMRDAAGL